MTAPDAIRSAYTAASGFEPQLLAELSLAGVAVASWHGTLALSTDPPVAAAWSLNSWTDPRAIAVGSISEAANALRAIQRNWVGYAPLHHRRATLITQKMPHVSAKPLSFPAAAPTAPLGHWTLLEPGLLLASPACSSPFANGEARFIENRIDPPSRAYLKLWEALSLLRRWPGAHETCLDLGAAPGGWTWALASLGAKRVVAVDKAPLDPRVAAMAGVEARQDSAFAIDPAEWVGRHGPVDWLVSDIIAYPARLLRLVRAWIDAGAARTIICTIKLQGEGDEAAVAGFASLAGATVRHLFHNRHELTVTVETQPATLYGQATGTP